MYNLYLAIAIAGELLGTSFIKATEGFTKLWPSVITILSYAICFYSFAKALEHIVVRSRNRSLYADFRLCF